MEAMKTILYPDNILIQKTNIVLSEEMRSLSSIIDEMCRIVYDIGAVGLAANQVGINKSFFVMLHKGKMIHLINPRIVSTSYVKSIDLEGCLSFPDIFLPVNRHSMIDVEYQTLNSALIKDTFTGLSARCFQHEVDHLNGITFIDKMFQGN